MTTEEKARAYDEALKIAQCWLNDPQTIQDNYTIEDAIQNIFPVLEKSEDERIRKEIYDFVKLHDGDTYEDKSEWLAWLKKQKEQKSAEWNMEDEQNLNVCLSYIKDEPLRSWLKDAIRVRYDKPACGDDFKWSEEDEKRIKQLIYDTEFIKAHYEKKKENLGEQFNNALIRDCDEQIAWLKSLLSNLKKKNEDVANLCSKEWSDEDEEMLGKVLECIRFAEDHYQLEKEETNGVSVKLWLLDHIIPQSTQEWSEKDEEMFDAMIDIISNSLYEPLCPRDEMLSWLKSLRYQCLCNIKKIG